MENIDALIINRLGEHQRKIDFINRNLNKQRGSDFSFKRISYAVLSVAACLAIIFAISPMLFKSNNISDISVTAPSFTEYRGSSINDIEHKINRGQYEDALSSVNSELLEIENELQNMSTIEMDEAEKSYTTTLYEGEQEELIWSKIYLLIKLDRKDDLEIACHSYLNNSNFSKHILEVKNILKEIQ